MSATGGADSPTSVALPGQDPGKLLAASILAFRVRDAPAGQRHPPGRSEAGQLLE